MYVGRRWCGAQLQANELENTISNVPMSIITSHRANGSTTYRDKVRMFVCMYVCMCVCSCVSIVLQSSAELTEAGSYTR